MPVVKGKRETRKQILIYSLALALTSLAPAAVGIAGWLYLSGALTLSALFLWLAVAVWRAGDKTMTPAKRLFSFSILYLFSLFALLLIERLLGLALYPGLI